MDIKIKLNGALLPNCAHPSDTGADLVAMSEPLIVGEKEGADLWRSVQYIEYDCGIQVAPEYQPSRLSYGTWFDERYGYFQVFPRSSISKTNLVLCNSTAIIDHAFRGPIKLRFRYLLQPSDMWINQWGADGFVKGIYQRVDQSRIYQRGDKIAQLVAAWKEDIRWHVVDSLDETARGDGGFGSTGWKS